MEEKNKICSKEIHAYQNEDGTYYVVKINERYMISELYKTKIRQCFVGKIVDESATNLYFELKNTKCLY